VPVFQWFEQQALAELGCEPFARTSPPRDGKCAAPIEPTHRCLFVEFPNGRE
jgi:hypothetical protein